MTAPIPHDHRPTITGGAMTETEKLPGWDEAIDAAHAKGAQWRGGSDRDYYGGIVAAAWPVLAAALADHIEAQERLPHAMQRYVRFTDVALLRACVAASVRSQGETE